MLSKNQNTTTLDKILETITMNPKVSDLQQLEFHLRKSRKKEKTPSQRFHFSQLKQQILDQQLEDTSSMMGLLKNLEQNYAAVLLVVRKKHLQAKSSVSYTINSKKLINRKVHPVIPICPKTNFANEQSLYSLGTGFFIGANMIATAAHLLYPFTNLQENIRFVWCPEYDETQTKITVHKNQVFIPQKTTADRFKLTQTDQDWALVSVRPEVEGWKISIVKTTPSTPRFNQSVYCIGHGLGLSKRIAYYGKLTKYDPTKSFFECQLSTFSGDSGSPVFDAETHQAIGMVVRAARTITYTPEDNCFLLESNHSTYEGVECQLIQPLIAS